VQPDREETLNRIGAFKAGDLRVTGFVEKRLKEQLDPPSNRPETAMITGYSVDNMTLSVESHGRALLVLSENSYPGWYASVNGLPTAIHEVDGGLRGIVVPDGASTVALYYAPWSIRIGAILSVLTLISLTAIFIFVRDS
jgi:uncharacterized membrane protein YfhO